MKKRKQSKRATKAKVRSTIKTRARAGRGSKPTRTNTRRATRPALRRTKGTRTTKVRSLARPTATGTRKPVKRTPPGSAARMAARVFARTATKAVKKSPPFQAEKPVVKYVPRAAVPAKGKAQRQHPSRPAATAYSINRQLLRMSRVPQFTYMRAPGADSGFDVGDTVEVFCDHERESERVRGWIKGVVVQVDNKLVAVQFRSNVFLTDGWMVPDRILWYALASEQIRAATLGRKGSRKVLPDF